MSESDLVSDYLKNVSVSFCLVEGCGKRRKKESRYCSGHSAKNWRYGSPTYDPNSGLPIPKLGKLPSKCLVESCDVGDYTDGLCRGHFYKKQFYGTPEPVCEVVGCGKGAMKNGYCNAHYQKLKIYGDPLFKKKAKGWENDGYKFFFQPQSKATGKSRVVPEHRMVMEAHLGRSLIKGETVHHINGVRNDNRLENLELWISSHPYGQRVSEHLSWAREIVLRYGDLVERSAISQPKKGSRK